MSCSIVRSPRRDRVGLNEDGEQVQACTQACTWVRPNPHLHRTKQQYHTPEHPRTRAGTHAHALARAHASSHAPTHIHAQSTCTRHSKWLCQHLPCAVQIRSYIDHIRLHDAQARNALMALGLWVCISYASSNIQGLSFELVHATG